MLVKRHVAALMIACPTLAPSGHLMSIPKVTQFNKIMKLTSRKYLSIISSCCTCMLGNKNMGDYRIAADTS